jgi:hypothetical protein
VGTEIATFLAARPMEKSGAESNSLILFMMRKAISNDLTFPFYHSFLHKSIGIKMYFAIGEIM